MHYFILTCVLLIGCHAIDFRNVPFQDVLTVSNEFTDPLVQYYDQLLFDEEHNQVIVGARDALFRLDLGTLRLLEKTPWPAQHQKIIACQTKGQSEEDCHNYVNVLLSHGNRVFTCGTGAFSPLCSWREIENLSKQLSILPGEARAAYSPHGNMTALMTSSGLYFAASPTDFQGVVPAITRSRPEPETKTHPISTSLHDSKWLNGAQFVGSFESDKFVFFLFRETAVEYINCGKIVYARIARVCKNDEGGRAVLINNWTTFLKARLNCSLPGDYPFYFDEIQAMTFDAKEKIVYATFTTPRNAIAGSAICAFNMSSIDRAFNGEFKHQKHPEAAWERGHLAYRNHFECESASNPLQLVESSKYQLMDKAVQPISPKPLYTVELETLTHIAVDTIPTKLHTQVRILYAATSDGHIKKISILPRTQEACVVGIWSMSSAVLSLRALPGTSTLYIGLPSRLLRLPTTNFCSRHRTRESCANAMDPHCGWNDILAKCTSAPATNPLSSYWHQAVTECPRLESRIDGGWSPWSSWFTCTQNTDNELSLDKCQCRMRQCTNPSPQGGGANCTGVAITVTNCTVHGGWTEWSAWSQCSQSCGLAVKTRYRTCGNPAPAHGGRVCVGRDRDEIYCTTNPPCPQSVPPPRDGAWSDWASWTECSTPCGGGFRMRARECNNPTPADGGQDCVGNAIEYETCNVQACSEIKKLSGWTPWMLVSHNDSSRSGYIEKRFKFSCKAPVPDPALIKIVQAKEEERYCNPGSPCTKNGRLGETNHDRETGTWSEWSAWSACSHECGGGEQQQRRTCLGGDECDGGPSASVRTRICNVHSCPGTSAGEWSCWTDWSPCSVTCGLGIETRTRFCRHPHKADGGGVGCEGSPMEQRPCEQPSCLSTQGWADWTEWSLCDKANQQYRQRTCLMSSSSSSYCQGKSMETRMCISGQQWEDENDIPLFVARVFSEPKASVDVGVILGSCVLAFILGSVLALVATYYYQKHRRVRIPGSPHYISKPNSYVTVPLREPPKRSSSSASSGSSGYKTSSSSSPTKLFAKPPDYETATIKRNSGMNGHGVRAQLDEDKFF